MGENGPSEKLRRTPCTSHLKLKEFNEKLNEIGDNTRLNKRLLTRARYQETAVLRQIMISYKQQELHNKDDILEAIMCAAKETPTKFGTKRLKNQFHRERMEKKFQTKVFLSVKDLLEETRPANERNSKPVAGNPCANGNDRKPVRHR